MVKQTDLIKKRKGLTLNSLREQHYSLTMRLLLAMSCGDEEMQAKLKKQLAEVEEQIDCMNVGPKMTY